MAYMEPTQAARVPMQVSTAPRKPRILLAASGSVAAIKFGNLCSCFSDWADVRAVATQAALHFIDRASLPEDLILYTDEHEWSSWSKIGDSVLHMELRRWADYNGDCPFVSKYTWQAMNTYMWTNPFTERHLMLIDELGITLIPPVSKRLACGDYGSGAMAEHSLISSTVRHFWELRANIKSATRLDGQTWAVVLWKLMVQSFSE